MNCDINCEMYIIHKLLSLISAMTRPSTLVADNMEIIATCPKLLLRVVLLASCVLGTHALCLIWLSRHRSVCHTILCQPTHVRHGAWGRKTQQASKQG